MSNKPILFVSPLPPPHGGIATWTQKIMAQGLPDRTPVTLVNTRIRGRRNIFDSVFFSFAEVHRTLAIYSSLLVQLFTHKPRLVHVCCALSPAGVLRDAVCLVLANIFQVPVVMHYHGNVQDFKSARLQGWAGKALRFLMRHADMNIVANTPSLNFTRQLLGIENNKVILLPNFIEDSFFQLEKKSNAGAIRAIYAGGITEAKGCAEIVTMALKFPQVEFHLFGKMHADMAEIYKSIPANIFLQGEVAHADLICALGQADFLLFPSYTEGFPLTVLEAMSLGLPVISTTVGGIPEMITEGQGGFLVQPRDTTALAYAIGTLISDPAILQRFGKYNKQKSFDTYRYSIVMTQLIGIYNLILAGEEKCVA